MKPFIILPVFFFYTLLLFGQERLVAPLEYNIEQAENYQKNSSLKLAAAGDTLAIPFFDDFTQTSVTPDPSKWIQNGGTFINNSYCINPPNYNVATFDGLKESGTPYNIANQYAKGTADNLTSKPIDLSSLKKGDSIYLRFYWQGKGLGEGPDATDSIRLQIKNRSGIWKTVWNQTGDSTPFNHEIIRIGDSTQYFHNGFQFKYQSFGRLSGSYDVWNIDYVMLDTGRLAKANWTPDLSFAGTPSSFLKNYTAMPASQYFPFKGTETADSISVKLTNLTNKPRGVSFDATESELIDTKNNYLIEKIILTGTPIVPKAAVPTSRNYYYNDTTYYYKPDTLNIPLGITDRIIKYKFSLTTGSGGEPTVGTPYTFTVDPDKIPSHINFRQNDSISGYCNLTDYYSYDDGTAEFGYGVNQTLGKVAVKYKLNTTDTLTHINIYFPLINKDQTGSSITLTIWNSIQLGTKQDNYLYRQTVALKHSTALNKFITYKLDTPLRITDSVIYVGYQQSTSDYIFTGLDKNINTRSKIFYNFNDTWYNEKDESGSLMIRPVFGDPNVLGITSGSQKKGLDCEIFPNPTTGEVYIEGKVSIMNLYDLSGKLILTKEFDETENTKSEDLSSLPKGFYIMHLENGEYRAVKKIILH